MDALLPQLLAHVAADDRHHAEHARRMMLTMHSTMSGDDQPDGRDRTRTRPPWGRRFDNAKNDDSFYLASRGVPEPGLPDEVMKLFLSPDGQSRPISSSRTRAIPRTPEGIARVDADQDGCRGGAEGNSAGETPRSDLAGTAATFKDMRRRLQVRPA